MRLVNRRLGLLLLSLLIYSPKYVIRSKRIYIRVLNKERLDRRIFLLLFIFRGLKYFDKA
jgi:hypothetical protein